MSSLAERPEMRGARSRHGQQLAGVRDQDLVGNAHYGRISAELPEHVLFAEDERGEVVAHAHSVPFALHAEGRGELPARGWDEVLVWAFDDLRHGVRPDTVSAISVVVAPRAPGPRPVRPDALGDAGQRPRPGLRRGRRPGPPQRQAPGTAHPDRGVRLPGTPRRSAVRPLAARPRPGRRAVIDAVAPASMTVSGSLEQWRRWTGLPFDTQGDIEVPGALVPVRCEPERGYAVYVEPNVWMRHRL